MQDLYATWNPGKTGKVMENRGNLNKTWKNHGICHLLKN
jgi:hypothetical protein